MKIVRLWFVVLIVLAVIAREKYAMEPMNTGKYVWDPFSNGVYVPIPPHVSEWTSFLDQKTGCWREDCK